MRRWMGIAVMSALLLLEGCAVIRELDFFAYREIPPQCESLEKYSYHGRLDKQWYACPIPPQQTESLVYFFGTMRRTVWSGQFGPETFISDLWCPTGVPKPGEKKRCAQKYWGMKLDGSIRDDLVRNGYPDVYPYVFAEEEQRSWRIREVSGSCYVRDMAGC